MGCMSELTVGEIAVIRVLSQEGPFSSSSSHLLLGIPFDPGLGTRGVKVETLSLDILQIVPSDSDTGRTMLCP